MAAKKIGAVIALEGEKQFRAAVSNCNTALKNMNSSLKLADAQAAAQGNSIKTLKDRHSALQNALTASKQKEDTIRDALTNARNNYTRAGEAVDKYKAELGEARTKLEEMKASGEASEQEIKEQEQAVAALEEELRKSEQVYEAAGNKVQKWEKDLNNAQLQTLQYEAALKQLPTTLQAVGQKMENVGEKLNNVGNKMTMGVTLPLAALGVAAVKTTAEFDSAMSKVSAVSGATGTDFDALRSKAREMGAQTKFSATEAAEAMNYMSMAGWKTNEMLDGIEGIMNLAAASGEDLATTSDIVTDALTAFGLSAKDSGHFADILAAASSNANTNVAMMGETFKYAAPVAGSLGFTAEDTAEMIGLMANSGIKASQAGTSLRRIFTEMSGDIEISGSRIGEVTVATTNADGSMRSLRDIVADCRTAFNGLTDSEKAQAASSIAGKNAMSGFLALMNASEKDVLKLEAAIDTCDGTALAMAETMQDNLEGQLTILKSQLQELAISFGDLMVPSIRKGVSHIQDFVDKLNKLDDGTKRMIIRTGLFVAAIGPVTKTVGTITTATGKMLQVGSKALQWTIEMAAKSAAKTAATVAETAAESAHAAATTADTAATTADTVASTANAEAKGAGAAATTASSVAAGADAVAKGAETVATEGATVAQWALNAAMDANPIGIIVVALAALTAGLVAFAAIASKNVHVCDDLTDGLESATASAEKTRGSLEDAGNSLKEAFDAADESIGKVEASGRVAQSLGDELIKLSEKSNKTAEEQKRMQTVVAELNSLFPNWGLEIDNVTGKLNKGADEIEEYISTTLEMTKVTAVQQAYKDIIEEVTNAEAELIKTQTQKEMITTESALAQDKLAEALKNSNGNMIEWNGHMVSGQAAIQQVANAQRDAEKETRELDAAMAENQATVDEAQARIDAMADVLRDMGYTEEEVAAVLGEATGPTDALTAATESLGEQALQTGDDLGMYGDKAEQVYSDTFSEAYESINSQIGLFDDLSDSAEQNIDDMINALRSQTEAMTNYNSNLEAAWEYAMSTGDEATLQLVGQIANLGIEGAGYLQAFVDEIGTDSGKAEELITEFAKVEDAKYEYAESMDWMVNTTEDGMDDINSAVTTGGVDVKGSMGTVGQNTRKAFNDAISPLRSDAYNATAGSNGVAGGINAGKGTATTAAGAVAQGARTSILNGMSSFYSDAYNRVAGSNGVAGGIRAGSGTVGGAASSVASSASSNMNFDGWSNGYDAVASFASGIRAAKYLASNAASAVASAVSRFLHHSTPDEGPLKGDDMWGYEMTENLAKGMLKAAPMVSDAAYDIAEKASGAFDISGSFSADGSGSSSGSHYGDLNVTIYGSPGMDVNQLADAVIKRITREEKKKVNAWA